MNIFSLKTNFKPLLAKTSIVTAIVTISWWNSAALAEETFEVRSDNFNLSIPMPSFSSALGSREDRQTGQTATGNPVAIGELIPKSESFSDWTQLFAVLIEEGLELSLDQYVGQTMNQFLRACKMNIEDIRMLEKRNDLAVFVIPCPNYLDNPAVGEVAQFAVIQSGKSFFKIYQHWRGKAFKVSDPASFPGSTDDRQRFFDNLQNIRISKR